MNQWLDWGIAWIVALQALGDWALVPMRLFSLLGSEVFFLLVMPAFVWCLDAGIGLRMGMVLLTSASLNNILKLFFGWPRPYWVSGQVLAWAHESSFGMPSGHAQNALAMWGTLAIVLRRGSAVIVLGGLILLISLSRLYLGVHFPADVIGGWLVAALLLVGVAWLERPLEAWLFHQRLGIQLAAPIGLAVGLLAGGWLVAALAANRAVPEAWIAAAAGAFPHEPAIDPSSPNSLVSAAGTLMGLGVGAVLLRRWGRFVAGGSFPQRIFRLVAGLSGIIVLYYGLGAVRPHGSDLLAQSLRLVNYAIVGFWVAYGAPRVFVRLRLA